MRRKFSSRGLSVSDAVALWRDWLSSEFLSIDVRDYEQQGFQAECELVDVGPLQISSFRGTSQAIARPQSLIGLSDADVYVAALRGTCGYEHAGHDRIGIQGDIVLFDVTRPYLIAHSLSSDVQCVVIPRKLLDTALGVSGVASGLTLDGREGSTKIIQDFFSSVARNSTDLDQDVAARVANVGVDLIAAGFASKLDRIAPRRTSSIAILVQTQTYVETHLSDSRLDVDVLAARLNISKRRLFEVFAAHGLSPSDYIWDRRLLLAHRLLADRSQRNKSIESIAYQAGFTTPSHFARRFKERFNISPSSFRHKSEEVS